MIRRALVSSLVLLLVLAACSRVDSPAIGGSPPASPTPAASSRAPSVLALTPTPSTTASYLAVVGDWGAGTSAQREVAARMCAQRKVTPFKYVVTTGDNFYPSGYASTSTYNSPEQCLIAYPGHTWRAVWGNHDVKGGTSTKSVLGAPKYYAWSFHGADLFALDANRPSDATQRSWLRSHLAASTARVKIVYFHQPPFTVGSQHANDLGVQRYWVPLFEQYNVTLVLNGHQHDYEHSRVRGVDYVVTGGGGNTLYTCVRHPSTLLKCSSAYHFVLLTIKATSVGVRAILRSGSTLDQFTVAA